MKKSLLASVALATASLSVVAAAPASAQATKLAIGVINVDAAVSKSVAYTTAMQQMQVTYKANFDDLNSRSSALKTEIDQKKAALQAAVTAAGQSPTPAQQQQLQTQYNELQQRASQADNEVKALQQPLQLAQAYVLEQIGNKMDAAYKNVMTKNKVDLLLNEQATLAYQPTVSLTDALTAELNALLPSVGIVPPQGWQPGGQQQQPAAAAPAAPAAGTTPAPQGR